MSKLRVPSLQHLARNWRPSPERVSATLVTLARNSPTFSYNPLFSATRDLLVFAQPYEEIVTGITRAIKREAVRNNLLGVLPMIRDHFSGVSPDFVQSIARRYYPVGRDLMVPFDPPMTYGVGVQLSLPWFSFWRQNPLAQARLSLFLTLVDEVLAQDPDLETAHFEILDFSAPSPKEERELKVIDPADIPRVTGAEKREMLDIFASGFRMAEEQLAKSSTETREERRSDVPPDHPDLFGGGPE